MGAIFGTFFSASLVSGLLVFLFFAPVRAGATLLRIIHTNDLHSHFDHAANHERGSYSAVKKIIDRLKAEAESSNIPTLVLDAGDFSEGSPFFLGDRGRSAFEMMNLMGYDAVALGNHDWLMGGRQLSSLLGQVPLNFPLLGANIQCIDQRPGQFADLHAVLKPAVVFERGGVRIAVMGVTTPDPTYKWLFGPGCDVLDPAQVVNQQMSALRRQADYVIALTHLGIGPDKDLVRNTCGIDLIVGGHSHSALHWPDLARDEGHHLVPIVQAGSHGEFVGDLLVDLTPGSPLEVLRYSLIRVDVLPEAQRVPPIEAMVLRALQRLDARYGKAWLDTVVGVSEVPLAAPLTATSEWGDLIAEAMRKAGRAQISVDLGRFDGMDQPAGPVRRRDILAAYPRMFETNRKMGWNVWTGVVRGLFFRQQLDRLMEMRLSFSVAGVRVETEHVPGSKRLRIREVYYNGRPMNPFELFVMALPEGLARGEPYVVPAPIARELLDGVYNTGISTWQAIETELSGRGTLRAYGSEAVRIPFNNDAG